MSSLHVGHIKAKLEEVYKGKIDISDARSEEEKENFLLTRSFAAYTLQTLALLDQDEASASIVDGFGDNGIDAVYFDRKNKELWLLQSKWIKSGKGEPETGEVSKFCNGIHDLIEFKIDRFNDKVKKKQADIEDALSDAAVKIRIVLTYTGQEKLSEQNIQVINDLMSELNDPTELAIFTKFTLKNAHKALLGVLSGAPINADIILSNWGKVDDPYKSIYGIIDGTTLAQLWHENRGRLFADNIREFVGFSDVNENMRDTALKEPQLFYYYNNGVTALCQNFAKKAIGGADRTVGNFEVRDIKIVNGAQTVGSIGHVFENDPTKVENIKVFLKIVSLDGCAEDFGTNVTKKTNTQNRVDKRDFVSLDPEQERLKTEFALIGITYHYKRSNETTRIDALNAYVEELITALACFKDNVDLAVQAKREVGKLWDDIYKPPYTDIVNSSLTALKAWRCIRILREVNKYLKNKEKTSNGRDKSNCIHSNRFVAHMVFRLIPSEVIHNPSFDFDGFASRKLDSLIVDVEAKTMTAINKLYKTSLIHQVYRNYTKCRAIKDNMLKSLKTVVV
ncbi:AIPR family protein [Hymenobacter cavernae]|uniref:Abortive infection phage resistance protein n=1 Tax=Hymenobacter cavernae TaxID=2044852 RepID=A0ABQ1U342_9BACT|nr:AIPR family protein [Hymenobacter cavernae]GGF09549.1 putative abortive infection phage resistance protein [Hymenobacter cavernae]